MRNDEINVRDPYIVVKDGLYYMYGTRGKDFGQWTGGFDVYVGSDLINWSSPKQVLFSEKYNMNNGSNWAPEVHYYNGKYYLFATFAQENEFRGTFSFVSDSPDGEFILCSEKALTPFEWWSLDGTLYVSKDNTPYLVFCHEHVQILDGTICYIRLSDDLSEAIGEPVVMFNGSDALGVEKINGNRYVTDGPFLYRGLNDRLYLIWSTGFNNSYCQCIAVSDNGDVSGKWTQLDHIFTEDGGHGMIFKNLDGELMLTLHCPNDQTLERPAFYKLKDTGSTLVICE